MYHVLHQLAATLVNQQLLIASTSKSSIATFVLQASQTTAQGLWLALGVGVILGIAIYVGGPFAITGSLIFLLTACWSIITWPMSVVTWPAQWCLPL